MKKKIFLVRDIALAAIVIAIGIAVLRGLPVSSHGQTPAEILRCYAAGVFAIFAIFGGVGFAWLGVSIYRDPLL